MSKSGGVAQLGERTVRIRKVESSILFVSTIYRIQKRYSAKNPHENADFFVSMSGIFYVGFADVNRHRIDLNSPEDINFDPLSTLDIESDVLFSYPQTISFNRPKPAVFREGFLKELRAFSISAKFSNQRGMNAYDFHRDTL